MQDWEEVKKDIQKPTFGRQGILKCRGNTRRKIVSNDGQTIRILTGVESKATKLIPYDMIKYGFDRLRTEGKLDSPYFHKKYPGNDCRYSTVGGVLVELKLADRHQKGTKSCYYTPGKGMY